MTDVLCVNCGHPKSLHEETHGYRPYGHCNFQHDLCGCRKFEVEGGQRGEITAQFERELRAAGLLTGCRQRDENGDFCGNPAEYVLWGKLFPAGSLGPRCYDHAAQWVSGSGLTRPGESGWALLDLTPLLRRLNDGR